MTSVIKSKVNILLIVVPDLGGGLGGQVVSMIYEESKSQLITEMVMIMRLFIKNMLMELKIFIYFSLRPGYG